MKLYLTSAYDVHPGLDTMLRAASMKSTESHALCEDAESADVIVFVENTQFDDLLFKKLRGHTLVKQFPEKVYMYNEMDRPWDVLPGLFTCMTKRHLNTNNQRAFAYLSTPNRYIDTVYEQNTERQWLYSFMGAMSHSSRRNVMRLPTDNAYLKDTSNFNVWNTSAEELDSRSKQYADVLANSQFVLCPRGIGTSSIRLYETLQAGRAPVIIADQWAPPTETDWSFAIQVKEDRIGAIPGILNSHASEAVERGDAARNAWLENYAPDRLFNTFACAIESLVKKDIHYADRRTAIPWNKWMASGGLLTRTTVQRLRGQR